MRGNLPAPFGLAGRGASAVLRGLTVVTTMACAARLASAPSPSQCGSRRILRQAPRDDEASASVCLSKLRSTFAQVARAVCHVR